MLSLKTFFTITIRFQLSTQFWNLNTMHSEVQPQEHVLHPSFGFTSCFLRACLSLCLVGGDSLKESCLIDCSDVGFCVPSCSGDQNKLEGSCSYFASVEMDAVSGLSVFNMSQRKTIRRTNSWRTSVGLVGINHILEGKTDTA